ncbi:MAG TPA: peptidoglycan-binding protein [Chthoniobacterales bacterium]|jgi:hypothetical protein|nr:peptidoglycan-binding protein [Chthoniobacterales bacterium]
MASPVFAEDQDQPKHPRKRSDPPPQRQANVPPPQRQANVPAPRTLSPPKIQQNTSANQFQNRPRWSAPRTYTAPKTFNPDMQLQTRNRTQPRMFVPPDQDAARTVVPPRTTNPVVNTPWQNFKRNRNPDTVGPVPSATPVTTDQNTTVQNSNWRNRDRGGDNRNWQNHNRNWENNNRNSENNRRHWRNNNNSNVFTFDQARRRHHRNHHDRSWWRSRYSRIALFAGGYYYWDAGYWYPAYGYDPYYTTYTYDEPIYGYDNLEPGQVIANVQAALQEQGYYQDEVDGLIGPRTRAALSDFQRDRGLPITAAIDGPTLQALGLN